MPVFELLLAVFAVFGFYMLLRLLLVSHALAQRAIVLCLPAETAPEALPILLAHARACAAPHTGKGVLVLVGQGADKALLAALREANIPYKIIEKGGELNDA